MKEIQGGEKALAIIGIKNVIKNEVPRLTLERMREFDKFSDKLSDLADKCVSGDIALTGIPVVHDYYETLGRIKQPLSDEDISSVQSRFPMAFDELASEFIVTLQNAWNHLGAIFPVSEYKDFTGAKNILPTGDKTTAFRLKLMVLNDPLLVYMLISSGAMLRSQAQAVQEFFTTLSAAITDSLYEAIERRTLKSEDSGKPWRMPERTKTGLGNWLGRRTVDYDPAPPPQIGPPGPQKSNSGGGSGLALSPSQKITDGGSVKNG